MEKKFVQKLKLDPRGPSLARQIWDAVQNNKVKLLLRLLITADANANTTFEQAMGGTESSWSPLASLAGALLRKNSLSGSQSGRKNWSVSSRLPSQDESGPRSGSSSPGSAALDDPTNLKEFRGCTLLHIACQIGDLALVEILLQHGAHVNCSDSLGRTPLHHGVLSGNNSCAKLLLTRYASQVTI
jgi:Arf-GAP/coiled-coil/ANK repeat/PH domain-containing protein